MNDKTTLTPADATPSERFDKFKLYVYGFVDRNFFLVFLVIAILCAFAYPHLGESSGPLYPDYTTSYVATMLIFVISGVTLKTSELMQSVMGVAFNATVQTESLLFIPLITWCAVLLLKMSTMSDALLDGLLIAGSLPTTVNMCVMLSSMAGGDEPVALFNATFGNFIGIFITPAWMMVLVSVHSSVSVAEVTMKLFIKVLIPVTFGQGLRWFISRHHAQLLKKYHKTMKRVQDCCLVAICYATFCNGFADHVSVTWGDLFAMGGIIFVLQVLFCAMAWTIGGPYCMAFSPKRRVAGLFVATHKTVAMGLPLIAAVYEGESNLGLYTIPILIYHPMQLFMGSFLIPYLQKYVKDHDQDTTVLIKSGGVSSENYTSVQNTTTCQNLPAEDDDGDDDDDEGGVGDEQL